MPTAVARCPISSAQLIEKSCKTAPPTSTLSTLWSAAAPQHPQHPQHRFPPRPHRQPHRATPLPRQHRPPSRLDPHQQHHSARPRRPLHRPLCHGMFESHDARSTLGKKQSSIDPKHAKVNISCFVGQAACSQQIGNDMTMQDMPYSSLSGTRCPISEQKR